MRATISIEFGHKKFPSVKELAVKDKITRQLWKCPLIVFRGVGTDHGRVYFDVEFNKEVQTEVAQLIDEILRRHSVRHLAKTTEVQPLPPEPIEVIVSTAKKPRSPTKGISPPSYLVDKATQSKNTGPAKLLYRGDWCGHGMETYQVLDIRFNDEYAFRLKLPQSDDHRLNPPLILVFPKNKEAFPVYDSREHVASVYNDKEGRAIKPRMRRFFRCAECGKENFRIAVGFEIPADSIGPNDSSWFALAAQCANCKWTEIIYDDETQ